MTLAGLSDHSCLRDVVFQTEDPAGTLDKIAVAVVDAGVENQSLFLALIAAAGAVVRDDEHAWVLATLGAALGQLRSQDLVIWTELLQAVAPLALASDCVQPITQGMLTAQLDCDAPWCTLIDVAIECKGDQQKVDRKRVELLEMISGSLGTLPGMASSRAWVELGKSISRFSWGDQQRLCRTFAADMKATDVSNPEAWAGLMSGTTSTRKDVVWNALAGRSPAARTQWWAALIHHANTLEPNKRSELLVLLIRSMGSGIETNPATWLPLLAEPLDKNMLAAIAKVLTGFVNLARGSSMDDALEIYQRCRQALWQEALGTNDPHQGFRRLGDATTLSLIRSLYKSRSHAEIHAQIVCCAATTGTLLLDQIPQVAELRVKVKSSATIAWSILESPPSVAMGTQSTFWSFSELRDVAVAFNSALKATLLELRAFFEKGKTTLDPKRKDAFYKAFKAAVVVVEGKAQNIKNFKLDELLNATFGPGHQGDIVFDEAYLNRVFDKKEGKVLFKNDFAPAIEKLAGWLKDCTGSADGLADPWARFAGLVQQTDFAVQYDSCYLYTIEPLNKNDIHALVLGDELACCLSPGGTESEGMIERLITPASVPVVVRQGNKPVATAWCMLATNDNGKPAWVLDFIDMKPSYTQATVHQTPHPLGLQVWNKLIDFMPVLAKAAGVDESWLGRQRYGRLKDFEQSRSLTFSERKFQIIGSEFMARQIYTDNISPKKGAGRFARIF